MWRFARNVDYVCGDNVEDCQKCCQQLYGTRGCPGTHTNVEGGLTCSQRNPCFAAHAGDWKTARPKGGGSVVKSFTDSADQFSLLASHPGMHFLFRLLASHPGMHTLFQVTGPRALLSHQPRVV